MIKICLMLFIVLLSSTWASAAVPEPKGFLWYDRMKPKEKEPEPEPDIEQLLPWNIIP